MTTARRVHTHLALVLLATDLENVKTIAQLAKEERHQSERHFRAQARLVSHEVLQYLTRWMSPRNIIIWYATLHHAEPWGIEVW